MTEARFTLVFEKLAEAVEAEGRGASPDVGHEDLNYKELSAIDELRRLALEISKQEVCFYTGT